VLHFAMSDLPASLDALFKTQKEGSKGTGTLPVNYSDHCVFEPCSGNWKLKSEAAALPKSKQKVLLEGVQFFVQKSPSNRAKCRVCGDSIDKESWRVNFPVWRKPELYSVRAHLECWGMSVGNGYIAKVKNLSKEMYGFDSMAAADKKLVKTQNDRKASKVQQDDDSVDEVLATLDGEVAPKTMVQAKAPSTLVGSLFPFQAEGLAWMQKQEESPIQGGILADEMGMGKTIQAVSLLLSRKQVGPTLVVVPMSAVMQWYEEIQKFTKKAALKTFVFHGEQRKGMTPEYLMQYDVVLTTYQTLEVSYRQQIDTYKVKCKYCQRLFLPDKLGIHLRYFCGPEAAKTAKQALQAKKSKEAARAAMGTMGITSTPEKKTRRGAAVAKQFPGLMNTYREILETAGKDTSGVTYWANPSKRMESNAKKYESMEDDSTLGNGGVNRERLSLMSLTELRKICKEKSVVTTGKKEDMIERLVQKEWGFDSDAVGRARAAAQVGSAQERINAMSATDLLKLKADEMRELCKQLNLSEDGTKKDMVDRLTDVRGKKARTVASEPASKKGKKGKAAQVEETPRAQSAPPVISTRRTARTVATEPSAKKTKKEAKPELETPPKISRRSASAEPAPITGDYDVSGSMLHAVVWGRVILDEAHRIKGRTTSTAMAAYALQAKLKWCLTGTPLQNRIGELYSLVRFLRQDPFAYYSCKIKGCDCRCFSWAENFGNSRFCRSCGHNRMLHFSEFKAQISAPITKYGFFGAGKVAFSKLQTEVLGACMLRRTKVERKKDMNLPPLSVRIRREKLSSEEKDFYNSLFMESCTKFDTFVKKGTLLHNYAHIFDLLTSLRRAADHPYLIVHGASAAPSETKVDALCYLCQDGIPEDEAKSQGKCGHTFHSDCVTEYIRDAPTLKSGGIGCPTCFHLLVIKDADDEDTKTDRPRKRTASAKDAPPAKKPRKGGVLTKFSAKDFSSSTKIEALVDEVNKMMKGDKAAKGIVFSQFTAMLDLIEFRMKRAGISCVKFTGSMSMQARTNALHAFNSDPSMKLILISLKAGGEGLNLQVANHIFLMDPWWNPACEMQAIQRAHRIGQTREVRAVRFVIEDTIENKIIQLQEKKQLVFDGAVGGQQAAMVKLTEGDLRFLFMT